MDTLKLQKYQHGKQEFLEYFINGQPLSGLLTKFYDSKTNILDNWIGVLGRSPGTQMDSITIKQLLEKNNEVLIYCSAEYGGIAVRINRTENSIVWIITDEDKILKLEFDKDLYLDEFNKYL